MDPTKRLYPAKLLLFGEHTVLIGSDALAIPYKKYFMRWIPKSGAHPDWLERFTAYLIQDCASFLDAGLLSSWLENRTIEANIPIGYGLGSSGALCAAIYDICAIKREGKTVEEMQTLFAQMESFFHGKSSGFDPLVSYFDKAIYKTGSQILLLEKSNPQIDCQIFLINSDTPRSGKITIQKFVKLSSERTMQMDKLIELNNEAIKRLLNPSRQSLFSIVAEISRAQAKEMDYMITENMRALWQQGIDERKFFLKICGAGGGGYYLLFTQLDAPELQGLTLEPVPLS